MVLCGQEATFTRSCVHRRHAVHLAQVPGSSRLPGTPHPCSPILNCCSTPLSLPSLLVSTPSEKAGGEVVEAACVIELPFLKGRDKIPDTPLFVLVEKEGL